MQFHYCIMLCVRNLCILTVQKVVHGDIYILWNHCYLGLSYKKKSTQCDNPVLITTEVPQRSRRVIQADFQCDH